jgi:uncharacterized protein YdeI (YjbR/CyaY-like superfamily)
VQRALRQRRQAKARFDEMSYSCRKEYIDWITSAKQEGTRQRRIEKMMAMIGAGARLSR